MDEAADTLHTTAGFKLSFWERIRFTVELWLGWGTIEATVCTDVENVIGWTGTSKWTLSQITWWGRYQRRGAQSGEEEASV